MKTILGCFVVMSLLVNVAFAGVVENWTTMESGMTGSYQDSNGSKIDFVVGPGPSGSEKAIKITANKVGSGYCGVYHNISADLSKSAAFKFKAKCSVAGDVQVAITDAFHVQYVAKFPVTTAWTEVTLPLASFGKDPYYTPPDAVTGHPMDLTKVGNFNLSPQMEGASVLEVGPISSDGTGSAPAASAPAAAAPAAAAPAAQVASGPGLSSAVMVQDFVGFDMKSAGTFQDSQGSAIEFGLKEKKGGQFLTVTYSLVGDYCGMWVRAGGNDWAGISAKGANTLYMKIYCKQALEVSISLTDKNGGQYTTIDKIPSTVGGKWETVVIPLSAFKLDPYYQPPSAIKGAPMDFSVIKQFNLQPKTKGSKITFAVDSLWVK